MAVQQGRIVSATVLDLTYDDTTGGTILWLRLDDGHEWHVILPQESLERLSLRIEQTRGKKAE